MKKVSEKRKQKEQMIGFRIRSGETDDLLLLEKIEHAERMTRLSKSELCRECVKASIQDVENKELKKLKSNIAMNDENRRSRPTAQPIKQTEYLREQEKAPGK